MVILMESIKYIGPDAELWTALQLMNRDGASQLPVMMEGNADGMLSRDDVITFFRTIKELGA